MTVDELLADPGAYEGAVVVVREATVVPTEPERGFVLESGEDRIPVDSPPGTPHLEAGAAMPAVTAVERILADDHPAIVGEEALFDDFEGEPTLAATGTQVVDG